MRRVQLQLSDDQADYLEARASREGSSIAGLMRGIVDRERAGDERQRRIDAALEALRKPMFNSGLHDVSERHDDYLLEILEEEMRERWG